MAKSSSNITRKKIQPVDFKNPSLSADFSKIKRVHNPNFKQPKHKVSFMFNIKSTVLSWALGALATIPEAQIWNVIEKVLNTIESRIKARYEGTQIPNFVNMILVLVRELLKTLHPDSAGGRRITKEEFKHLVSFIIDKNWKQEPLN